MVKRLDLHLGLAVIKSSLLVLGVFLAITYVFTYVAEAAESDVPARLLLLQVLDLIPRQAQVILPFALFIGTLVGIGNLANANELTIFRVSGISVYRLVVSTTVCVLTLFASFWAITEYFLLDDPELRLGGGEFQVASKENEWVREGDLFTFIKHINNDGQLSEVIQFEFAESNALALVRQAGTGDYDEFTSTWTLRDVREVSLGKDEMKISSQEDTNWRTVQTPNLLLTQTDAKPKELDLLSVMQQMTIESSTGSSIVALRNEFWTRVFRILTSVALTLLAFAFVLGSTREMGMGTRISLGLLVGLCFHLIQDFFAPISLVFPIHPVMSMAIPILTLLGVASLLLKRVA